MTDLKIGVIGCGNRGLLSRHAHDPDNGVRLTAAADISDEALREFKEAYGSDVFVTKDYSELLEEAECDAVFATSPIAARMSVAAGVKAAESLRNGATPQDVPALPLEYVEYFDG